MKKLFLLVLILALLGTVPAFAEVAWKSGIGFSLIDYQVNVLSTIEVIKWKNIALEVGYVGDSDSTDHKAAVAISYPLLKLKDYVDVPLADYVNLNFGIYAGYGRITGNNEFDWGGSLTAISFKF